MIDQLNKNAMSGHLILDHSTFWYLDENAEHEAQIHFKYFWAFGTMYCTEVYCEEITDEEVLKEAILNEMGSNIYFDETSYLN